MIFLALANYDGIRIDARDLDKLRIKLAVLHDSFHLDNDPAATVFNGLRDRGCLERGDFPLQSDIAVFGGIGSTDESDVDRERFIYRCFSSPPIWITSTKSSVETELSF